MPPLQSFPDSLEWLLSTSPDPSYFLPGDPVTVGPVRAVSHSGTTLTAVRGGGGGFPEPLWWDGVPGVKGSHLPLLGDLPLADWSCLAGGTGRAQN